MRGRVPPAQYFGGFSADCAFRRVHCDSVYITVQVLESPAARRTADPLPAWLAEIVFAAGYLLKGYDWISDHFVEIGLSDDALILLGAIERNQKELHACLGECIDHAIGKRS